MQLLNPALLFLASASASLLPIRSQIGTCVPPQDNSANSLASPFTLTGIHRRSGTTPRFLPLFSSPSTLSTNSNTSALTIVSSSSIPSFTLDSGVLSTSDGVPCFLYIGGSTPSDAQVICSDDASLKDPSVNRLAETTWATGTQCLDVDTEIVVLVPVFGRGARHSKPFYANEQAGGEGLLKYCVGNCIDNGPLTSLRLEVVYA